MLGQRNDGRDRKSIRREIGGGGHHQQHRGIVLRPENWHVVDAVGEPNRERGRTSVEDHLHHPRPVAIEALGQNRSTPERERLSETQLQDAQQNEQEVDRHGARDSGQIDLEARRGHRDQQVASELNGLVAAGVHRPGQQDQRTQSHDHADVEARTQAHGTPRLCFARHFQSDRRSRCSLQGPKTPGRVL